MPVNQTGPQLQSLFVGVERTIRAIECDIRLVDKLSCLHVDAGSESTCTIGGCTCSPLHLHVLDR